MMKNPRNRYAFLATAAAVNFVHGNPYIWTVFQPYASSEYGLDAAGSSRPFTFILASFVVGNIAGGRLQHKIGARNTVLSGLLIMCLGFFLTALAPSSFPWLLSLGYGIIGGFGSGIAFSVTVAVTQEWFPDRLGMATGVVLGIVGISGVIMNPLCDLLLARFGFRPSMMAVTAFYALISFTGGWFIRSPEKDEVPAARVRGDAFLDKRQYTTKEMLHTKTFYLLTLSQAFAIPAYVLVNPLMKSLGIERGLSDSAALTAVVIASFFNIIGRFAAPWISDRIGRVKTLLVLLVLVTVSIFGMTAASGALYILLISFISLTYGGFVGVFPSTVADIYGLKYQAANNGASMIGYGIVSILCPYLLSFAEHTAMGANLAFIIAGIIGIAGIAVTLPILKADK